MFIEYVAKNMNSSFSWYKYYLKIYIKLYILCILTFQMLVK